MSFINNIITPIIQGIIYLAIILWILYMVFWVFIKLFPNWRWNLKYGIFRSGYKESDVKWCVDAIERGMKPVDVKKFLLIHGQSVKRTDEISYIFRKINKKIYNSKGGDENDRQFRQSNGEFKEKEIPEYKG